MLDKKEAKRQYKETYQPMGVYCITNSANGKIYIGSSQHVQNIFNRISFQLKRGSYTNEELQKDYSLQGEVCFSFEVLDYLKPDKDKEKDYNYTDDLKVLEDLWLEKLKPYGRTGYNLRKKN